MIASVSGWKAQCRKIAKEKGFWNLVDLQPSTKGTPRLKSVMNGQSVAALNSWIDTAQQKQDKQDRFVTKPKSTKKKMAHPDALFGRPTRKFAVESCEGKSERLVEMTVCRYDIEKLPFFKSYLFLFEFYVFFRQSFSV